LNESAVLILSGPTGDWFWVGIIMENGVATGIQLRRFGIGELIRVTVDDGRAAS
jgi:hypothetical protein